MNVIRQIGRITVATLALGVGVVGGAPTAAHADSYVPITGAGSTWSQVAIDAWRADVRANGLVVNYSGTGSSDGRAEYIQHTVDFAVSEIPFENPPEPGQQPEVPDRPYAYLPIVAGGTSFMYHLTIAGKQFRGLRLSGATLTGIFTGQITRWNDPAIVKENGGRAMPAETIVPVIRSDGSGASAQFSRYMLKQFPGMWCPFAHQHLGQPSGQCSLTSYYPTFGNAKSQVGSNGVANYVAASYGEGAIGYVEYAYAKRVDYPVASLLNAAGYYTQPIAGDVAVALTKARINNNLTQNLDAVYTNPDPRTYLMSSYSYLIAPTTTASPFNADKGRSLSTFVNYFLCAGQQKAQILGYSPVPSNLVQAGFDQVQRIPGHVAPPALSSCNNPALRILTTAPQPQPCQRAAATPCDLVTPATAAAAAATTGNRAPTTTAGAGTSNNPSPTIPVAGRTATGSSGGSTTTGPTTAAGQSAALATPVALGADPPDNVQDTVLAVLAVVAVAAAVAIPFLRSTGREPSP